jgi:Tol biopolymer transport system component
MKICRRLGPYRFPLAVAGLALALARPAAAQATSLVSSNSQGHPSGKDAYDPTLSPDGRWVGFFCYDDLLEGGARFVHSDTYLRDRLTGALERVSVSSSEAPGDSFSYVPSFTPDVRYVVFVSYATNLAPGDTNGPYPDGLDVFVRDRVAGTTERVSVGTGGTQGNDHSYSPSISADGRWVAFASDASNLVPGDTNATGDVFLRDRVAGTTQRVSVGPGGAQGNGASAITSISADGRYLAYTSNASNLVAGDTNGKRDVFVHDRVTGATERVSLGSAGLQGSGDCFLGEISPDGRFVAFASVAPDLVTGDANGSGDVFLRDRVAGTTELVSVSTAGTQGGGESRSPSLTSDGRYVAFYSDAPDLVPGDTNGERDVFLRDRLSGTTERVSVDSGGVQGAEDSGVYGPAVSGDGRFVAFDTRNSFVEVDSNASYDVYIRDRHYVPIEGLCEPGVSGVVACPCSNPPGAPGRGCDNSAATGGASLSAQGTAHLSIDTLVFRTSGEPATALSILLQGDALVPGGTVFGQGVRCAGGTLLRLYTKSATAGGVVAPEPGDPSVSARSAALGDAIAAGESRFYLVYYRDPIVLGGCPAASTFNATPTGEVRWLP